MKLIGISFILHLVGIVFWIGSSLLLPLAILPAIRKLKTAAQIAFIRSFKKRFLPFLTGGALIAGLTGWYQTVKMEKDLVVSAIYTKHIVILLLIAVSIYVWFFLAGKLVKSLEKNKGNVWNHFALFSWIQAGLGVLVLICTGWLTQ